MHQWIVNYIKWTCVFSFFSSLFFWGGLLVTMVGDGPERTEKYQNSLYEISK